MKDGFIRVASATPKIKVADCQYNTAAIIEMIGEAYEKKTKIIVFPELCITGYTCNDLFFQNTLLDGAIEGLSQILDASKGKEMLIFVGLPYMHLGKLYNVAAVVRNGRLLAMIPMHRAQASLLLRHAEPR